MLCARPAFHLHLLPLAAMPGVLPGAAFAAPTDHCGPTRRGPVVIREADANAIARHVKETGKSVLTFVGYSGAGYEDGAALQREASRILDQADPRRTLISSGATAEGIGAIYELAREKGFDTMGIVSSLACRNKVPLSPCVDVVFFVPDSTWGGALPGGEGLSPTSTAVVGVSDALVGIGGGAIARDELLAARRGGKPVNFIPADMNHRLARQKALRNGQPEPQDFSGEASAALEAP